MTERKKLAGQVADVIFNLTENPDRFRCHDWNHLLNVDAINATAKELGIGPIFTIGEAPDWATFPNLLPDHPANAVKVPCLTVHNPNGQDYQIRRLNGGITDRPIQPGVDRVIELLKSWDGVAQSITDTQPPQAFALAVPLSQFVHDLRTLTMRLEQATDDPPEMIDGKFSSAVKADARRLVVWRDSIVHYEKLTDSEIRQLEPSIVLTDTQIALRRILESDESLSTTIYDDARDLRKCLNALPPVDAPKRGDVANLDSEPDEGEKAILAAVPNVVVSSKPAVTLGNNPHIVIEGTPIPLKIEAATYLKALIEAADWMSMATFNEKHSELGGHVRYSRLGIPDEVKRYIEGPKNAGCRWLATPCQI